MDDADVIGDLLGLLDQTGHVAVVNEQACSLLDLSAAAEELIGSPMSAMLKPIERMLADPEAGMARLKEIADSGETVRFVHFECADGRRVTFEYS